jgi:hypothetical protein
VLTGLFISATLLGIVALGLYWRKEELDISAALLLPIIIVLLWVIPWGLIVLVPFGLILSVASPAARQQWSTHRERRIVLIPALIAVFLLSSSLPLSTPTAPDDWLLISEENPDAMFWPASEQYTWLHEEMVISVLNIRTPHTFSTMKMADSTLAIGLMLDLDDARLSQSLQQIKIDPDTFYLKEIKSDDKHTYSGEEYVVLREQIILEGFTIPIGEVLLVAFPSAGGELTLLSIVRLNLSIDDIWEEAVVNDWIASQGDGF